MLREWQDSGDKQSSHRAASLFAELKILNNRIAGIEDELKKLILVDNQELTLPSKTASLIKKFRERRNRLLPGLFGEPAWDILLALMAQPDARPEMQVSAVGHAAEVPQTTALRHLAMLERAGLIERRSHPTDRRSMLVCLTPKGRETMETLLEGWPLVLVVIALPVVMMVSRIL